MLALRENGIKNVLVSFGLNISSAIIYSLISLNPKKIIVAFNNDGLFTGAGNRAAETARQTLINYFDSSQVRIALPTGGKDFGDLHLKDKNKIIEWNNSIK
jgi:DNA primase